jgi:hypothetical protein
MCRWWRPVHLLPKWYLLVATQGIWDPHPKHQSLRLARRKCVNQLTKPLNPLRSSLRWCSLGMVLSSIPNTSSRPPCTSTTSLTRRGTVGNFWPQQTANWLCLASSTTFQCRTMSPMTNKKWRIDTRLSQLKMAKAATSPSTGSLPSRML